MVFGLLWPYPEGVDLLGVEAFGCCWSPTITDHGAGLVKLEHRELGVILAVSGVMGSRGVNSIRPQDGETRV